MDLSYSCLCAFLQLLQFCFAGKTSCTLKWVGKSKIPSIPISAAEIDLTERYILVKGENDYLDKVENAVDEAIVDGKVVLKPIPITFEISYNTEYRSTSNRQTGLLLCISSERMSSCLRMNYDAILYYGQMNSFLFGNLRMEGTFKNDLTSQLLTYTLYKRFLNSKQEKSLMSSWSERIVMEPGTPESQLGWYELDVPQAHNCEIDNEEIVIPVGKIYRLENRTFSEQSQFFVEFQDKTDTVKSASCTAEINWETREVYLQQPKIDGLSGLSEGELWANYNIYFSLKVDELDWAMTHRRQYSFLRPSKIQKVFDNGVTTGIVKKFNPSESFRFAAITSHTENWNMHHFKITGYETSRIGEKLPAGSFAVLRNQPSLEDLDQSCIHALTDLVGNKLPGILVSDKLFPDLPMARTMNRSSLEFIANHITDVKLVGNGIEIKTFKSNEPITVTPPTYEFILKRQAGKSWDIRAYGTLTRIREDFVLVTISRWALGYRNVGINLHRLYLQMEKQASDNTYSIEALELDSDQAIVLYKLIKLSLQPDIRGQESLKFICTEKKEVAGSGISIGMHNHGNFY